MTLLTLDGLDGIDWASLRHAYGSAEDVPELLRRVASGDGDEGGGGDGSGGGAEAAEALNELWGTIWHQGSVYSATVAAVPYLAKIAAAGVSMPGVLQLLGSIAESSCPPREAGEPDALHEAVTACCDAIAPLIDSPDGPTRAAAMYVLAYSGSPERVGPLIVERWRVETDPTLRAEALHAMMRVDPGSAAELADEVLSGGLAAGDGELRVSCALAWIRDGRAWDERVFAAALSPLPEQSALSRWSEGGELFELVVQESIERIGVASAIDLVIRALNDAEGRPAEVAEQRLQAAEDLIVTYRSAVAPLADPIARFLDSADPGLIRTAAYLHSTIAPGMAAPAARDRLAALAESSDEALTCLIRWHDPAAPGLFARDIPGNPRVLDAVGRGALLAFDAELLAAIRRRLTELIDSRSSPTSLRCPRNAPKGSAAWRPRTNGCSPSETRPSPFAPTSRRVPGPWPCWRDDTDLRPPPGPAPGPGRPRRRRWRRPRGRRSGRGRRRRSQSGCAG